MSAQLVVVSRSTLTRIVMLLIIFSLLTESAYRPSTKTTPTLAATTMHMASTWKLVWSDEFDGPQGVPPDPRNWTADVGGHGWGNQQLEYDTNNQNANQDGQGNLVLEARKGNPAGYQCWYGSCQYTSARLTTRGSFSFTYGLLEARIKIPYDQGIWPAFWLLGDKCETVDWPTCGEIDIMENVSPEPATIHGSGHGPEKFSRSYTLRHDTFADDFHIFAVHWDTNHLYFLVDGDTYAVLHRASLKSLQNWVYDHPFHILLNVAVGGNWPGSPNSTTLFPQKMLVSYVRLYTQQ